MNQLSSLGAGLVLAYLALPLLTWAARRDAHADPQSRQAPLLLAFLGALVVLLIPTLWPAPPGATTASLPLLPVWPDALMRVTQVDAVPGWFITPLGVLCAGWLVLVLGAALRLTGGLVRLRFLARRGLPVDQALAERVSQLSAELLIAAPAVRISAEVAVPLVVPGLRPTVLLPAHLMGALDADALELALRHELTHIARRDHRVAALAAVLRLPFVFHPSGVVLERELAIAREEAVDARVSRDAPSRYAQLLLDVTELRPTQGSLLSVPAMSDAALVRRVRTLLDGRPRPLARWTPVALLLVVLLTAGFAARPGASPPSTLPPALTLRGGGQRVLQAPGLSRVTARDPAIVKVQLLSAGQALLIGAAPGVTGLSVEYGDGRLSEHQVVVTGSR